jgi:hypothetical protein
MAAKRIGGSVGPAGAAGVFVTGAEAVCGRTDFTTASADRKVADAFGCRTRVAAEGLSSDRLLRDAVRPVSAVRGDPEFSLTRNVDPAGACFDGDPGSDADGCEELGGEECCGELDSVGEAEATPCPVNTAAPMPKATANPIFVRCLVEVMAIPLLLAKPIFNTAAHEEVGYLVKYASIVCPQVPTQTVLGREHRRTRPDRSYRTSGGPASPVTSRGASSPRATGTAGRPRRAAHWPSPTRGGCGPGY